MVKLFGTDGVRGLANGVLTAELALDLSVAAAHVLADRGEFSGHRPLAVVGRDTRISGQFLEAAVVAGLASAGVDVLLLGVLPTPGVAHMTGALGADLGVMLSASHNAMPDNGIKFLARGGVKLDDAIEEAIEAYTKGPAWASFEEDVKGTVAPGRFADIAVFDTDLVAAGWRRRAGELRAAHRRGDRQLASELLRQRLAQGQLLTVLLVRGFALLGRRALRALVDDHLLVAIADDALETTVGPCAGAFNESSSGLRIPSS